MGNFAKLRKNKDTLQKLAYESIRREIIRGSVRWGERLSEEFLANSLNISRTPVREAIFQLEKEGLLEKNPHKGFFVRKFTSEEIQEIFRLRSVLELLVIDSILKKADKDWLSLLEENVRKSKEALLRSKIDSLIYLITEFHEILYRASGSPKLCAILSGLGGDALINRCLAVKIEGVYEDFVAQHERLANALKLKDKAMAEEIIKTHLEEGRRCALQILRKEVCDF
jgi:DNA-binding GntR family transcriptional regulator